MESLQKRIDSFSKPKRSKAPRWPHPMDWVATPSTLAEAGFYYDPSSDDPDNVTCFMCGKQVTDWAEEDDPFDIHWEKCAKTCPWANIRCGLRRDLDKNGRYVFSDKNRIPTSKAMEQDRLKTYNIGKGWIHDKQKTHGATSKKMAQAGFVYTPTVAGDDTASCLYCKISLSGWDEDDDPMEEHRKREQKTGAPCPLLAYVTPISAAPSSKPQKPPSKSTQRQVITKPQAAYTDLILPTKIYDGSESSDSAPRHTTKTPRKPRAASSAKTPRTITRSQSRAGFRDEYEAADSDEEIVPLTRKRIASSRSKSISHPQSTEDEDEEEVPAPPAGNKATKSKPRSKSISQPNPVLDPARLFDDEAEGSRSRPMKDVGKTPRKPSRSRSKAPAVDTDIDEEAPVGNKRSRSKVKQIAHDVDEDTVRHPRPKSRSKSIPPPPPSEPSEPDENEDWVTAPPSPPRPSRRLPESTYLQTEDEDMEQAAVPPKTSRSKPKPAEKQTTAKKTSRSKAKPLPPPTDEEGDDDLEQDAPAPLPRPSRKASKSIKAPPPPATDEEVALAMKQYVPSPPPTRKPSKSLKPPPPESTDDDIEEVVATYTPAPPTHSRKPSKSKSKAPPPPKIDEPMEELEVPKRVKRAASRSTSRTIKSKPEPVPNSAEDTEQDEEELVENTVVVPVAPPIRARKPSSRSTAAPASRSTSKSHSTAKPKSKQRTPAPEELPSEFDELNLDGDFDDTVRGVSPDAPAVAAPVPAPPLSRQVSRSKPRSNGVVTDDSHAGGAPTLAEEVRSSFPIPATQKHRAPPSEASKGKAKADPPLTRAAADMKVVEISDEDEPRVSHRVASSNEQEKMGDRTMSTTGLRMTTRFESTKVSHLPADDPRQDEDVDMAEVDQTMLFSEHVEAPREQERERSLSPPLPSTPPSGLSTSSLPSKLNPLSSNFFTQNDGEADSPTGSNAFSFVPPLATDRFDNLQNLSEAELDMTVEEWIRYQVAIEYESFKKDGERELANFQRKAEEVRRAIEAL